jgi:hypothetical protein
LLKCAYCAASVMAMTYPRVDPAADHKAAHHGSEKVGDGSTLPGNLNPSGSAD